MALVDNKPHVAVTRDDLRMLEPISSLSNERLDELVSLSYMEEISMGVSIFREGDVDNQTIYLLKGDVQLKTSSSGLETTIRSNSKEGRFPLDDSQPRQYSAVAMSSVDIVRIDNSVLDYMMMWDQLAVAEESDLGQPEVSNKEDSEIEKMVEQAVLDSIESAKNPTVEDTIDFTKTIKPELNAAKINKNSIDLDIGNRDESSKDLKQEPELEQKTDSKSESKSEHKTETKIEVKSDQKSETKTEPKADQKVDTKLESKPEQKTDSKAETKPEQETESKAETKPEQKTESKAETKPEQKTESKAETKPEQKTESKAETKPEQKTESKAETNPEQKTDSKSESKSNHNPIVHESRDWIRKIRQIMAFKNMPPANIKSLLERMESINVDHGDTIIKQGDEGDFYYIVTDGTAVVTRTIELATLSAGTSFGEEALVAKSPRNASVTMTSDGILMRLSKKDFDELLIEPLMARVSADEARSKILKGAKWLDVRHAKEFHHSRLPGAINIPLHELRLRMAELDKEAEYICCCRTGARSSSGSFLLAQNGFNVSLLNGGIQVMSQDLRR